MDATDHGAGPDEVVTRLREARLRRQRRSGSAEPEPETRYERDFRVGRDGERKVGTVLDDRSRQGAFAVLHSLGRADGGDIDHVTVGPGGVTVIDTKTWSASVRIRPDGIVVGGRRSRRHLAKLQAQVGAVREALAGAGLTVVPVRGAICLANENPRSPVAGVELVEGLAIGRPDGVARLAAMPGSLPRETQHAALAALREAFPRRGGPPMTPSAVPSAAAASPAPLRAGRSRGDTGSGHAHARRRRPAAVVAWGLAAAVVATIAASAVFGGSTPGVDRPAPTAEQRREARQAGAAVGRLADGVGSRHVRASDHQQRRRRPAP